MTRDPDDDYERKRMELALREANLGVHQAWLTKAEHMLDTASNLVTAIVKREVPDAEYDQAVGMTVLLSTHISAISTFVQTAMMVESEASNVQHLLGHQQHEDEQQTRAAAAQEVVKDLLGEAVEKMREKGIDAYPAPGGFPGIVIRPPQEGPDGPLG
jgi:hypothetical protein